MQLPDSFNRFKDRLKHRLKNDEDYEIEKWLTVDLLKQNNYSWNVEDNSQWDFLTITENVSGPDEAQNNLRRTDLESEVFDGMEIRFKKNKQQILFEFWFNVENGLIPIDQYLRELLTTNELSVCFFNTEKVERFCQFYIDSIESEKLAKELKKATTDERNAEIARARAMTRKINAETRRINLELLPLIGAFFRLKPEHTQSLFAIILLLVVIIGSYDAYDGSVRLERIRQMLAGQPQGVEVTLAETPEAILDSPQLDTPTPTDNSQIEKQLTEQISTSTPIATPTITPISTAVETATPATQDDQQSVYTTTPKSQAEFYLPTITHKLVIPVGGPVIDLPAKEFRLAIIEGEVAGLKAEYDRVNPWPEYDEKINYWETLSDEEKDLYRIIILNNGKKINEQISSFQKNPTESPPLSAMMDALLEQFYVMTPSEESINMIFKNSQIADIYSNRTMRMLLRQRSEENMRARLNIRPRIEYSVHREIDNNYSVFIYGNTLREIRDWQKFVQNATSLVKDTSPFPITIASNPEFAIPFDTKNNWIDENGQVVNMFDIVFVPKKPVIGSDSGHINAEVASIAQDHLTRDKRIAETILYVGYPDAFVTDLDVFLVKKFLEGPFVVRLPEYLTRINASFQPIEPSEIDSLRYAPSIVDLNPDFAYQQIVDQYFWHIFGVKLETKKLMGMYRKLANQGDNLNTKQLLTFYQELYETFHLIDTEESFDERYGGQDNDLKNRLEFIQSVIGATKNVSNPGINLESYTLSEGDYWRYINFLYRLYQTGYQYQVTSVAETTTDEMLISDLSSPPSVPASTSEINPFIDIDTQNAGARKIISEFKATYSSTIASMTSSELDYYSFTHATYSYDGSEANATNINRKRATKLVEDVINQTADNETLRQSIEVLAESYLNRFYLVTLKNPDGLELIDSELNLFFASDGPQKILLDLLPYEDIVAEIRKNQDAGISQEDTVDWLGYYMLRITQDFATRYGAVGYEMITTYPNLSFQNKDRQVVSFNAFRLLSKGGYGTYVDNHVFPQFLPKFPMLGGGSPVVNKMIETYYQSLGPILPQQSQTPWEWFEKRKAEIALFMNSLYRKNVSTPLDRDMWWRSESPLNGFPHLLDIEKDTYLINPPYLNVNDELRFRLNNDKLDIEALDKSYSLTDPNNLGQVTQFYRQLYDAFHSPFSPKDFDLRYGDSKNLVEVIYLQNLLLETKIRALSYSADEKNSPYFAELSRWERARFLYMLFATVYEAGTLSLG